MWGTERVGNLVRKRGKQTDPPGPQAWPLLIRLYNPDSTTWCLHDALQMSSWQRNEVDLEKKIAFGQVKRRGGPLQERGWCEPRHEDGTTGGISVIQQQTHLSRDKLCEWEAGYGTRKVDWGKFWRPWTTKECHLLSHTHTQKLEFIEEPLCCIV